MNGEVIGFCVVRLNWSGATSGQPMPSKEKRTKSVSKRSRTKLPGLDQSVNSKLRWDLIDHDYLDKLSDKEKQWLSDFNEAYISGSFKKGSKKFGKTKKERRESYSRNNSRNRDLYAIIKATGYLKEFDVKEIESRQKNSASNAEDILIEHIDSKNEKINE